MTWHRENRLPASNETTLGSELLFLLPPSFLSWCRVRERFLHTNSPSPSTATSSRFTSSRAWGRRWTLPFRAASPWRRGGWRRRRRIGPAPLRRIPNDRRWRCRKCLRRRPCPRRQFRASGVAGSWESENGRKVFIHQDRVESVSRFYNRQRKINTKKNKAGYTAQDAPSMRTVHLRK